MGATAIFGYKASTYVGVGINVQGNMRGSIMGSTTYNAWIINFHIKAGKPFASNPTAWADLAIYKASSSGSSGVVTDFVGESASTFPITGVMGSGSQGQEYSKAPAAPIQRFANQPYALMSRSDANSFNHGQDHSGLRMHRKLGYTPWPDPYAAASANPEGKMAIWVTEVINTAPKMPSAVLPVEDGSTTDTTPSLSADFRDDEEVVGSFAIGQADKLKKYRYEVYEGSARIRDSGILTANGTQQSNRRSDWTVSPALNPGTYNIRCTHWDMFDQPSPVKSWNITVNSGGSVSHVLQPAVVVGTDSSGHPVTNSQTPGIDLTWTHGSAADMTQFEARMVRKHDGVIVNGPTLYNPPDLASGSTLNLPNLFSLLSWGGAFGIFTYAIEINAQDSLGGWTGYMPGPTFSFNLTPLTPLSPRPTHGSTVADVPTLSVIVLDFDDFSSQQSVSFRVRKQGDGSWQEFHDEASWITAESRWAFNPGPSVVDENGIWEWSARATDPWGLESGWMSTTTFTLVDPPAISSLNPPDEGTVTSSTPTISASVDRTVSSYRVEIMNDLGVRIIDSGTIVSGTISYSVTAGILKNNMTVTLRLTVNTSDGLSTQSVTTFTVDYVERGAVTTFVAEPSAGDFEPVENQFSEILLSWDQLPTTGSLPNAWASAEEFGAFIVRRTNLSTSEEVRLDVIENRTLTSYLDRTPQSGTMYEYSVSYLYEQGGEWIESVAATDQISITLQNAVISDLAIGGRSIPIRFWESRGVEHNNAIEVVPTLGRRPIIFQGLSDFHVVDVEFQVLTDVNGTYTARDHMEALSDMAHVEEDEDGDPVPRNQVWRDAKGRLYYGAITYLREEDDHMNHRGRGRLVFTESATHENDGEDFPD